MTPSTVVQLALLLTAIVPGYLTIYLWSRNKTWKGLQNDLQTVLKSVAISALIQVFLLPYVLWELYPVRDHVEQHPLRITGWLGLTVLVMPYLLGTVAARVSDHIFGPTGFDPAKPISKWRTRLLRIASGAVRPAAEPSVWDWAVAARKLDGCYVVITCKDGTKTAGTCGIGSISMTNPEQGGIFLSEEWLLDERGDFLRPVANTEGILVPDISDVRSVRLLKGRQPSER